MPQTRKAHQLGRVLEVRQTQRLAAEMDLSRKLKARDALDDRRRESLDSLADHHRAWSRTVQAASFNLGLAQAWVAAIEIRQAQTDALSAELTGAAEAAVDAKTGLLQAIARCDCVEKLSQSALRRLARGREAAVLNALDDQTAQRGRMP
jgi:hypothetical protein